jgi:hypothetical protein
MRTTATIATLALLAVGVIGVGQSARASDDEACTKAPKEQWQTIDQLTAKLSEQGYKVKKIEFEDGCAEAKVEDPDGKKAELKLDPVNASVVKKED